MNVRAKPAADIDVSAELVRALLESQHPDLAHLPVAEAAEGWDNAIFRLGDDLAVRVPRREVAAALIEREQRWLPALAATLPLPTPVPMRVGRADALFPWPWSIVSWLPGSSLAHSTLVDEAGTAALLDRFFPALHVEAPADAPVSPWRGLPLATRTPVLHDHLRRVEGIVDCDPVLEFWDRVLSAPPWPGPPVWLHGDLHPGNLLVQDGRLSGVIDFGDLTSGDPATDLSLLWMLPAPIRARFTAWPTHDLDAVRMRARGWAVAMSLAYLAHASDDDGEAEIARRTITAALTQP